MSRISTHVLDTSRGRPAAGVAVVLEAATPDGAWAELARGVTDTDGRVHDLSHGDMVGGGEYRLRFATGDYFRALGVEAFYPEVTVHVRLSEASARYHLPLLLSPFAYT